MIRQACAASALLGVLLAAAPAHAGVFDVDPFDRGWFGVNVAVGFETGDGVDVLNYRIGFVFRWRWAEFSFAPISFADFTGRPPDVPHDELAGRLVPAYRLTGPWRLAPFVEYRSDVYDGTDYGGGPQDKTDVSPAIGLRWQLDRHWTLEAYGRRYDYHGVDRISLPEYDMRADVFGVAVDYEF